MRSVADSGDDVHGRFALVSDVQELVSRLDCFTGSLEPTDVPARGARPKKKRWAQPSALNPMAMHPFCRPFMQHAAARRATGRKMCWRYAPCRERSTGPRACTSACVHECVRASVCGARGGPCATGAGCKLSRNACSNGHLFTIGVVDFRGRRDPRRNPSHAAAPGGYCGNPRRETLVLDETCESRR